MGLDMYLYGEKSVSSRWEKRPKKEDGFVLGSKTLDIAYWRKHANLHGFIVNEFADGEDNCQKIPLGVEELERIIAAIESDEIYEDGAVTGFFFGRSIFPGERDYDKQKAEDLKIFQSALEWLNNARKASGDFASDDYKSPEWREIYYQASW